MPQHIGLNKKKAHDIGAAFQRSTWPSKNWAIHLRILTLLVFSPFEWLFLLDERSGLSETEKRKMKTSIISICAYVVVTLTALSQNPPANPTPPANPVSPVNPTQPQAPVGRNQLPPGFQNRAVTAGLSNQIRLGAATNAFLATNQFG